jgi:hypothetical protein
LTEWWQRQESNLRRLAYETSLNPILPDSEMERNVGIEPTYPVWKTGALPIGQSRLKSGAQPRNLTLITELQAPGPNVERVGLGGPWETRTPVASVQARHPAAERTAQKLFTQKNSAP